MLVAVVAAVVGAALETAAVAKHSTIKQPEWPRVARRNDEPKQTAHPNSNLRGVS